MKNKLMAAITALILTCAGFTACSESALSSQQSSEISASNSARSAATEIDDTIDASDYEIGYDESSACKISFNDESAEISGDGAEFKDAVLTISKEGTYVLSGKLSNGRVVVNAGEKDDIRIILSGADITCNDNSPFTVLQADKVSLTLEENSKNSLADASECKTSNDDNTDACLFSKADLTVNGNGSLEISANYKHGIVSKDDLIITGGKISVTSKSTAINGKDSVRIAGGELDLSAGTNGIKADNTQDASKGFISVSGGKIKIVSNNDGIEAETLLKIDGGSFDITTGGGSKNASTKSDGQPNGDWKNNMNKGGGGMRGDMYAGQMPGGQTPDGQMPDGQTPPDMPNEGIRPENVDLLQTAAIETTADGADGTSTSAKALKSGSDLLITQGEFKIDSADDSVHSGANISFTGASLTAASGDDGIHADKELVISGGEINITKSYEGIEGMTTTVLGGTINVTSSDDGINCSGGSDTGSETRMGRDQFASQQGVYLKIGGGNITVNAGGDGLDSNGDLFIEDGTVVVYGPTNSGNASLDYNGKATISGGSIIALGAMGMEQSFTEDSSQCSVLCDFDTNVAANTELTITDQSGKVILKATNPKNWQGVVFSSADIEQGKTYTLKAGENTKTIEVTSVCTVDSNGRQMGMGGGKMKF